MAIEVSETRNGKTITHRLDPSQVDELDEISGDEQQALVWCESHKSWEWHWIDRTELGNR
ncbi:hypothetical protein CDO26_06940 [Sinorhizobium meliloti]|uniref:hypothetical protein n=1 Tax=Rhizobium meliloti TaxID=382 RepID=UPI000B4A253F|nr:hypothetical protein [Sinorhizobium meliloti]ASP84359.1 hypothetical protein CDO26_06940 [Sinorhizobium meliloti]MQW28595.1 hypothetical protein [Sinorhizobium meliloti]